MKTSQSKPRVLLFSIAVVAASILGMVPAGADSALVSAELPSPRSHTSAVWIGGSAFIFGGQTDSGSLDEIVRFTPSSGSVTIAAAKLPSPSYGASAVTDGSVAYIFGGQTPSGPSNQILRYDPASDSISTMGATLPIATADTTAFWDGTNAYIAEGGGSNRLLKYSPATDAVSLFPAVFPAGISRASAVWTGSFGYVLANRFYKVNVGAGTIASTATTYAGFDHGAVFHGSRIYLLGGSVPSGSATHDLYQIQDYNIATDKRWPMTTQLPGRRGGPSAVGDGTNLWVFGGIDRGGSYQQCSPAGPVLGCPSRGRLSEIVKYFPASAAPKVFRVLPGTGVGQNNLYWEYPDGQTWAMFSYPTGFRIYRRVGPVGEPALLTTTGVTLSYADNTCPVAQTCWYQVSMVVAEGEGDRTSLMPGIGWKP